MHPKVAIRVFLWALLFMAGGPLFADSGSLFFPIVTPVWGGGTTYRLNYQESNDGTNISLVLSTDYVDARGQVYALYWNDGSVLTPCVGFNLMRLATDGAYDGYGPSAYVGHFRGVFPPNCSLVVKTRDSADDTLAAYHNNVYPNSTILEFFPASSPSVGGGGDTGGTVNVRGLGWLVLVAAVFFGVWLVKGIRP